MARVGFRGRTVVATNPRPGVEWGRSLSGPSVPPGGLLSPPARWDRGRTLPGGMLGVYSLWCHRLGAPPRGRGDPVTGCPMPVGVRNLGARGAAPKSPRSGVPRRCLMARLDVPAPGVPAVAPLGIWARTPLRRHHGGVLGGSWRARGSPGEGGGWMAATPHGGCGEAAAGTGLTGWVPAPGVPGGSGGHAAGAARGPAQGHCPQGHPPR